MSDQCNNKKAKPFCLHLGKSKENFSFKALERDYLQTLLAAMFDPTAHLPSQVLLIHTFLSKHLAHKCQFLFPGEPETICFCLGLLMLLDQKKKKKAKQ